jgi:dTDP-4-amino-4,6-dideoxygalactose transaminase
LLKSKDVNMAEGVRPRIPLAPVLSGASFRGAGLARIASVLDAGAARLVTSGRVAIALALKEMGVGPGDAVLVPAYHSASMIPPVLWRGAAPVFYRVRPDTSVDLDDIAARLTAATKVLMVTNYFGFPQDLAAIRAFCDARGLLMLEDCAHCFFGEHQGRPVGSFGDYAIASTMKFFPIYEGGCLVSARHPLAAVRLRSAGAGFEAKAALAALENSFAFGRLGALQAVLWLPMMLKQAAWKLVKARRGGAAPALAPGSSDSSFSLDPYWIGKRSSLFSRLMLRLVSARRIVALRRQNYARLQAALHGLPDVRPLFASLPDGACPWQFPLLADDPEGLFAVLHAAGVPMVRFGETLWPGVDAGVCAASVELGRRVLAFPCHQELREDELAWMIGQITGALRAGQARAA